MFPYRLVGVGIAPALAVVAPALSRPYRPYHTHDEIQKLKPGQVIELDVELWPTSIVVPAGYRVGISIRRKDYEYGGASGGRLSNFKNELKGCGPFLHGDPVDRPPEIFGGVTTPHFGRERTPYVLVPVIPGTTPKRRGSKRAKR